MKLYFTPGACSLAVHIVLREGGFDFNLESVDLATRRTGEGENFLAINPKGYVPALLLDAGKVLTEVPVILQFLADFRPETGLAPAQSSSKRYQMQEWLNFIATELHKGLSPLFDSALPDAAQQIVMANVSKKLSYLDVHLADNDYLMDDRFTIADSYAFAILNWKNFFNIDLAPWPNVAKYYDHILDHPCVSGAMRAEGLLNK